MDEELHRSARAIFSMAAGITADGAFANIRAVIASKPHRSGASDYNLARALHGAKRTEEAKEQLLLALEAAPASSRRRSCC